MTNQRTEDISHCLLHHVQSFKTELEEKAQIVPQISYCLKKLLSSLHSKHILTGGRGDTMPTPLICLHLDMTAIPCSPHVHSALYLLLAQALHLDFFSESPLLTIPMAHNVPSHTLSTTF